MWRIHRHNEESGPATAGERFQNEKLINDNNWLNRKLRLFRQIHPPWRPVGGWMFFKNKNDKNKSNGIHWMWNNFSCKVSNVGLIN